MASADTLLTFGETLRDARLKRGRSLDDLASSLKINRRHLEAIEAGNISALPQGPYVTAFVREYARALGLEVPAEYASPNAPAPAGLRDPKVVSHPARSGKERVHHDTGAIHDAGAQISHVARDTARLANTAVKSAVKSVTRTTENVVNMVETGSKEALEVLTSKSLWEEAEDTRRERHGLPPLERKVEEKEPPEAEAGPEVETNIDDRSSTDETERFPYAPSKETYRIRTTKRTTNLVIVLLALLFAGAAYFAIRMSGGGTSSNAVASKDYVPAPVDKPPPIPAASKPDNIKPSAAATNNMSATNDSLRFVLRVTQPVWVSIAPDGIPAYRGELKAGDVKSFRAASKIVINLGNQKAVAMEFNGAPLSGLPTIPNSSVVVRNLVLMRDKATLDGNPFDIHKTPAAASPKPVVPVHPAPAVSHTPVPVRSKAPVVSPKPKPAANKKAKAKPAVSAAKSKHKTKPSVKKPMKKDVAPPTLHQVEPIPPRP